LFDVLAYIAFAMEPITRSERVEAHKGKILDGYDDKLQTFLEFVLGQYETEGVSELDQEKLPTLLELKYSTTADAAKKLGGIASIKDAFVGFQKHLYR
jgi:type I restriction enzyme R subunit